MTMPRWQKVALIAAGMLLLLAVFVAYLLPVIVISQAEQRVEAATGRKLEIGAMSFNPFTLVVVIDDFRFSEIGGKETFATFSRARIVVNPLSLFRRATIIDAAYITSPHFRIVRIGENNYNLSDLRKWLPLHPRLSVNNLTMTNGSVDFIDRALPAPQRQELRKIELSVPFITTMATYSDRFITPRLSAELNGTPLQVEGKLRPFPRAAEASLTIKVQDLSLPDYLPYLPTTFPLQIEAGRLSGQVVVTYRTAQQEKPELTLGGSVILADVKVSDRSGAPFLAVTRFDAEINHARFLAREFEISSLIVDGLEVFLTRDAKGVWSHNRLAGEPSPGAPPRRKALAAYSPYFAGFLPARVKGRCDAAGKLAFGGPEVTRLEVANLTIRDGGLQFRRDRQKAVLPLTWNRLQLNQLKWSFAPFALDIGQMTLSRFYSEIIVAPDGSLNLAQLSPAGKEQKRVEKRTGKMIRIATVTLENGTLLFSDRHVPGGYSTTLYNLGGRINGLSSESNRFADVNLSGSLENRSPLTITGQINPLRGDLFVDLKLSFTAIELAPMTPYAVTYLGYAIDQGQLFLNSTYRIKNSKLDVENKLRIKEFDFGKRRESEKEISPTVRLAVALLKDRQGKIHLDLPVTGRTDDPHFSVRNLTLELLRNLLRTAEEAPLALLPTLSGTPEDWSSVGFAPGSSELSPGEQEKLLKLATALNDRPALKIRVVGFADRGEDDDILRSLAKARAAGVRTFLIEQGKMDGARLLLERGDINRAAGSRVVFKVVIDD